MDIPYLMPHQLEAFNGDQFIEREFLRLRDQYGIETAIETGTCFGATTGFLAREFKRVITIESNPDWLEIARERLGCADHVLTYLGASEQVLDRVLEEEAHCHSPMLFYLDAHWGERCPLPDELRIIARRGLRPVIAIHDMKVPGEPGLAFDSCAGQPFTFDWLRPLLDAIYGPGGYAHYYNSEANSMAVKVGILYVTPKDVGALRPSRSGGVRQKIRLFLNFYTDGHAERQQELDECLSRNIDNPLIDEIYAVVEGSGGRPEVDGLGGWPEVEGSGSEVREKVTVLASAGRPTFADLFTLAAVRAGGQDISIIANADIYFEAHDLGLVGNYLDRACCFALSRWERRPNGSLQLFDRDDSQDCWIFRGPLRDVSDCAFSPGRPGCDNALANRLAAAGYRVLNPARAIRAIHLHNTGIRHYDPSLPGVIVAGPYLRVPTVSLEGMPACNWVTNIHSLPSGAYESQFGEEAIIDHIFEHIGVTNRYYVDLGAGAYADSTMSNTRKLRKAGWSGFGVDMNSKGEEGVIERFVKPETILALLEEQQTPESFDFLSLDLDSSDFWVLKQLLQRYRPRCICTEFNGTLHPVLSVVLRYEDGYTWDKTNKYGYSFGAGKKLLEEEGYRIVCNQMNQNIFAVAAELVEGLVFSVTAERVLYHPENPGAVWEAY